jgi:putative protease
VRRQLTKLGNTPYEVSDFHSTLDKGLMLPISALNALRRAAVDGLEAAQTPSTTLTIEPSYAPAQPQGGRALQRSAHMTSATQLTDAAVDYFDVCYLPPKALLAMPDEQWARVSGQTELGVALPPVVMDHEREALKDDLITLATRGARRALLANWGHLPLVRQVGLAPDGDLRLNVTNTETVALCERLGISRPILSPELTLPQIRDIGGEVRTVVYGRIPLMLLEKCVIREVADCKTCDKGAAELLDRRGVHFPVQRLGDHRNIIYNSLPTYMADEQDKLGKYRVGGYHFIFSTEAPREVDEVVRAYRDALPAKGQVRRIGK